MDCNRILDLQWQKTDIINGEYNKTTEIHFSIPLSMNILSGLCILGGYQSNNYHKLVYKLQLNGSSTLIQYYSGSGLGVDPHYLFYIFTLGY